jgi:uncharacterized protein (TIGR00369 family)
MVAEPRSVEARFGLSNCRPRGGESHCDIQLGKWALQPNGEVQLGALAIAADHVVGEVSFIRRPLDTWSLTSELSIDFVAPIAPDARIHAWATPTRIERSGGFAQGQMIDETGQVVAFCSTRTLQVPSTPIAPAATRLADIIPANWIPAVGLEEHLELDCAKSDSDEFVVRMSDPSRWQNDFGMLHGGVWACLNEVAASRIIARVRPELTTAGLRTAYLRPGMADAPLTVTARLRHAGSRLAVAECTGRSEDGTICTLSTVTARRVADLAAD